MHVPHPFSPTEPPKPNATGADAAAATAIAAMADGAPGALGAGAAHGTGTPPQPPHARPRVLLDAMVAALRGDSPGVGVVEAGALHLKLVRSHEQALVCLSNREIVDASRGRTFHYKMASNCCFL